jgi:hypothetical protein
MLTELFFVYLLILNYLMISKATENIFSIFLLSFILSHYFNEENNLNEYRIF